MQNKTIYLLSILILLILALAYTLTRENELPTIASQAKTKAGLNEQYSRQLSQHKPPNKPKQVEEYQAPTNPFDDLTTEDLIEFAKIENIDCTNAEWLNSDLELTDYEIFKVNSIYYDYTALKPYSAYAEDELIEAANNGDALAMYTLGKNYQWFAGGTSSVHPSLQYDAANIDNSGREYAAVYVIKAKDWLLKAAINGYPTALFELATTTLIQRVYTEHQLKSQGKINSEEALITLENIMAEELAYEKISFDIMPDFVPVKHNAQKQFDEQFNKLNDRQIQQFKHIYNNTHAKWTKQRTESGRELKATLPLNIEQTERASYKYAIREYCRRK